MDSREWYDNSVEDGTMYARAEGLGASQVVLASKARVEVFLAAKVQGTIPIFMHLPHFSLFHLKLRMILIVLFLCDVVCCFHVLDFLYYISPSLFSAQQAPGKQ